MKKFYILILLLSVMITVSAQKMTIKTDNGNTVEVTCDGIAPNEITVAPDGTVTFKMKQEATNVAPISAESEEVNDSVDTFVETDSLTETHIAESNLVAESDSTDSIAYWANALAEGLDTEVAESDSTSSVAYWANALAEELDPEYAEFNKKYANTHPKSEKEVVEDFAKGLVGEDVVEKANFFGSLFKYIIFSDSTFIPQYEQRKPKKSLRAYDIIELEGSFGKNFMGITEEAADKVSEEDYGDDTENKNKFGAGIKYSRVYMPGTIVNGEWKPNFLGFAYSWGGMLTYSYEPDMGAYFNAFGKVGIQIGTDIAVGADALIGCGITPYNTFYTNYMNHSVLNKSAFCFKYGVQVWGSLNFSKDTYTSVYARYVAQVNPTSSALGSLPNGWDEILCDFDPSSWTIGLAVGYKFGAPKMPSTDKRLQASFNTGYQVIGEHKGLLLGAEVERLTKVSRSTELTYGLAVEQLKDPETMNTTSVLLSAGFNVCKPAAKWFWGTKIYGGIGDYAVKFTGDTGDVTFDGFSKKLCMKFALQLSTGFKIGKCSEIFASCRGNYHFGYQIDLDGFQDSSYENLKGFELDTRLGYKFTF